jgi:hypothetical protein
MKYVELFGYPLSGKSTYIKYLNDNFSGEFKLAATDKTISRLTPVLIFVLTNKQLINLYFKLPSYKFFSYKKIKKFISFSSRYKDYLENQSSEVTVLLDEGISQSIWGLLSFFSYDDYQTELFDLVELSFDSLLINSDLTVVCMNELNFDEFKKRSDSRLVLHTYIKSVLTKNTKEINKYEFCYSLILNKLNKCCEVITIDDFSDFMYNKDA